MSNPDQQEIRQAKLARIQAKGNAYPNHFKPDTDIAVLHQTYDQADSFDENKHFKICGRVMTARYMGKAVFLSIQDRSGRIQCYVRSTDLWSGCFLRDKRMGFGGYCMV